MTAFETRGPSDATATVPAIWREFFAGRKVAFVEIARKSTALPPEIDFVYGAMLAMIWGGMVLFCSVWIGVYSGHWWVGALVFAVLLALTTIVMTAVRGDSTTKRQYDRKNSARTTADPIGKLLPPYGASLRELNDPASYAGLFTLEPRPALVIDVRALQVMDTELCAKPLAPRGRFPEPEFVDIEATQAELGPGGVLRADLLVGAGWLRDPKGEIWTVDDSVLVVSRVLARGNNGKGWGDSPLLTVNMRLVKPGKVREIQLNAARPFFQWPKPPGPAAAADAAPSTTAEFEMPTAKEPLRLLLSSWTYPEPRPDLAMRE
jgi:hypothetical protein